MKLGAKGTVQEQQLLLLVGIEPWDSVENYGLLLGRDEPPLASVYKDSPLYVRLPNTDLPLQETEALAHLLGSAIGQGEIRL